MEVLDGFVTLLTFTKPCATVVQWIEQRPYEALDAGSNPVGGTSNNKAWVTS